MRIARWTAAGSGFGIEPGGGARWSPRTTPCVGQGATYQIRRADIGGGMRGRQVENRTALGPDAVDALEATASALRPLRGRKETQLPRCLDAASGRAKPDAAQRDSVCSNTGFATTKLVSGCRSDRCGRPSVEG